MNKFKYKVIADILLVIHILWVIVLIGGTIFMVYHRWYVPYHIIIVTSTLFFNLFMGGCPLTWWEEKYRKLWDPNINYHHNSFAATYLKKFFRIDVTPKQINWVLILIKIVSYYTAAVLLTLRRYI